MKYVALLRGINVGGKNIIKMTDLKDILTQNGFEEVLTYIQSGNVIFSTVKKREKIITEIEALLSKRFNYAAKIVLLTKEQLAIVLDNVPREWHHDNDLRCYISFIKDHIVVDEIVKDVPVKEGVDSVKVGKHVLYLSTKLSGLTKSSFTKLIGTKLYQDMTMRNYATTQKIFELMK